MSYQDDLDTQGVKWMGQIPPKWCQHSVKRHYNIQLGKMLQNGSSSDDDVLVPYLKALYVLWGKVNLDDLPDMWASSSEIDQYGIKDGDLLVCEGGEVGRAGIVKSPPDQCIIQNALHRVRSRNFANTRFLQYVLQAVSNAGWFEVLCNKATIAHFTREKFADLRIPIPTVDEQQAIAMYLERETEHIATLISKKQRQIELLQEKRAALISHVVTKGLNPNAKMKDSGIEWLGDIPEHWDVIRLKHVTSHIVDCLHATPVYSEDGLYPAVRTADVRPGILDITNVKRVSEEEYKLRISRLKPIKNDIIYSREGERFGIAALVPEDHEICLSQRMMMFRCKQGTIDPTFLMWQLNGKVVYLQAEQDVIGATSPHVNVETIRNFWLTLPPYQDQLRIMDFIEREVQSIDTLTTKINCSMQKLSEYRTTLISAAVTGKIDVRKEVA
jgi:type I restriction enzyme, S subunit